MFTNSRKAKLVLAFILLSGASLFTYTNCSSNATFNGKTTALSSSMTDGVTIYINDNDEYTNKTDVTLKILNNNAHEMYITNALDCSGGGNWEPYAESKLWTLSQTNGEAKVYIKFREFDAGIESTCQSDMIIHDNEPPMLVVLTPAPKLISANSVQIKLRATDDLSGVNNLVCKDSKNNSLPSCLENLSISNVVQGPGYVKIVAVDKAGNSSNPVVQTWISDLTPPTVVINSKPALVSNKKVADFTFSGTDNLSSTVTFQCKIDSANYADCSSPVSYNLNEGLHKFFVRAKDEAGNVSVAMNHNWTIDVTAPGVTIGSGPSPYTSSPNATFVFGGTDSGGGTLTFQCQLDQGGYKPCVSGHTITGVGNGPHTFSIQTVDGGGNVSTPTTYSWVVDNVKPTIKITTQPNSATADVNGTFQFLAEDIGGSGISKTECSLDNGAYQVCNASITYPNLSETTHTFRVRTTDKALNMSDVSTVVWLIDRTPPVLQFVTFPSNPSKVKASLFAASASDLSGKPVTFVCKLDGESVFTPCLASQTLQISADGVHTFSMKAMDTVGNTSAAVSYTWLIDSTGPAINFTKIPAPTNSIGLDTIEVAYQVTDSLSNISSISCGLSSSQASCSAVKSTVFTSLGVGSYTYTVQASDALGNSSTNSVTFAVSNVAQAITQNITVNQNKKADVLIVIDNSGSMNAEQANMASRFSTFLDKINGLDWRVAVVTTDVSANADKKDGRFLPFTVSGKANDFITSSMDLAAAKAAFAKTIQRPASEGSGNEQGIAGTYRAIERSRDVASVTASTANRNFFRSDAVLSVIVVTDANETNPSGTQTRNIPANLVSYIKSLWPTKPFVYNSIIVKSGDTACLNLAGSGNESYGTSYETLSGLTAGEIGSVCATNYTAQLQKMGQSVVDLVKVVNLDCLPIDKNKNGSVLDDISTVLASGAGGPGFTVSGQTLTYGSDLPVGTHSLKYWCLK